MKNQKSDKVTPRIASGFMELLPGDQIAFNSMLRIIQDVYESFGFLPIETPVMELADVLLAKGGGETDKQVYRLTKGDTNLCLRFDLTVPLARYVSQYANQLSFPFRRYQMQRVYRGEGAQKGRYREFYQCDIDTISDNLSVSNDAEMPAVIYEVFKKLQLPDFTIKINNRKILNGIFELMNIVNVSKDILTIIDKLEKIGREAVESQLLTLGLDYKKVNLLLLFLSLSGSIGAIDSIIDQSLGRDSNVNLCNGLEEIKQVINSLEAYGIPRNNYRVDLGIARGLDYYTGTIYETTLNDYPEIGSICSGGRYDDLCKFYTDRNLQGVGISIGLTRLFYQLKTIGAISSNKTSTSRVVIAPFDYKDRIYAMQVAKSLRSSEIPCEIYLDDAKLSKKFKYASNLGVPYVIVVGDSERSKNTVTLKDLRTGEQKSEIPIDLAIATINWEKNHR